MWNMLFINIWTHQSAISAQHVLTWRTDGTLLNLYQSVQAAVWTATCFFPLPSFETKGQIWIKGSLRSVLFLNRPQNYLCLILWLSFFPRRRNSLEEQNKRRWTWDYLNILLALKFCAFYLPPRHLLFNRTCSTYMAYIHALSNSQTIINTVGFIITNDLFMYTRYRHSLHSQHSRLDYFST